MIRAFALAIVSGAALSGCATGFENHGGIPMNSSHTAALEAFFDGYRVNFYSVPAGADIECEGVPKQEAPFPHRVRLTTEQRKASKLEFEQCEARWNSGAKREFTVTIPLSDFPYRAYVSIERPADVPGQEADEAIGRQLLHQRAVQIQQLNALAGGIASSVTSTILASRRSAPQPSAFDIVNMVPRSSSGFAAPGSIQWNWVRPGTMPSFSTHTSMTNWTPVFPATSCTGSVIQGVCHGAMTFTARPQYCAGSFVNGQCLGPVLFSE